MAAEHYNIQIHVQRVVALEPLTATSYRRSEPTSQAAGAPRRAVMDLMRVSVTAATPEAAIAKAKALLDVEGDMLGPSGELGDSPPLR